MRWICLPHRGCFCAAAPEEEWNKLLINGMTVGKGEISPEDFYSVTKKRIERTLIRTVRHLLFRSLAIFVLLLTSNVVCLFSLSLSNIQEGGSYQQRILTEYLKGIQSRVEEIVQVLQGNQQ